MKKKRWKRLSAVFLACCLTVSMAPAVLAADDDADSSDDQNTDITLDSGTNQNVDDPNDSVDSNGDDPDDDNQDDSDDSDDDDWGINLGFKEKLREDGWTWCYTDEDLELSLNTDGLDGLDDLKYDWVFNWYNDSIDGEVAFTADLSSYVSGSTLFIPASDLAEIRDELIKESGGSTDMLQVYVYVTDKEGKRVAYAETGVSLRKAWYDYSYPCEEEINLVAGWDYWLGDAFSAHVENSEYPGGEDIDILIEGVEVKTSSVLSDGLPPVKVVTEEDDEGNTYYSLTAKKFAWGDSAMVIITYTDPVTNENASYEVKVNVVDTTTDVYIDSYKTSNQVLPKGTVELYANVEQQWDGGNAYLPGELEEEVILEWSVDRDDVTLSVDKDAPHKVLVTVGNESDQEVSVTATVYAKDGDGKKGEELASSEYSLWIVDEYYEIQYTTGDENGIDALYPGHSIVIVPELYYYNSEETKGVQVEADWEWEYDENALAVDENEQGRYTITRLEAYGTDLGLRANIEDAETEELYEAANTGWYLNDVYSEIWFEEPDWDVIYTDSEDPYTLQLNTEQLEGMKYHVEYQLVVWPEDEDQEVEITNGWSVEDDVISLQADEIYAALKNYVEDSAAEVTLRAVAFNDKTDEEVSATEYSFGVSEPYFDYWFTTAEDECEVWTTLVGVEDYIWAALDGMRYGADAPYGEYEALKMTGYEIEDPDMLTIKEEDGYYKVTGNAPGETKMTISYIDYDGNEQTMNAVIVVSGEAYYLDVTGDYNSILPGELLTLTANLYRYYVDENGDLASERISDETTRLHCEWGFSWGNDKRLFKLKPSEDNSFICTVEASEYLLDNYANGSIYCKVYNDDDECVSESDYYVESTNDPYYDWTLSDDCWIGQVYSYYYLGYDNAVTFAVNKLVSHYIEDGVAVQKPQPLDGITYRLLTDEDTDAALNIAENGNGSYTVTRKADGEVVLRIGAYRNKTKLDEYEVTFRDYSVYTVADPEVSLCPGESATVKLSIYAGRNYDPISGTYKETEPWSVSRYEWRNEDDVKALGADLTVTQSDDTESFTISLADGSTAEGNVTVELAAYLMDGTVLRQTVALGEFGHTYVSTVVKEATTTEEGLREYTCTKCGNTYTEAIPKIETPDDGTTDTDNNSGNGTAGTSNNSGNGTTNTNTTNKTTSDTTAGVKTGDNAPIWLMIVLLVAALGGISGVVVYKRRVR